MKYYLLILISLICGGCSSATIAPNESIKIFPTVTATRLSGESIKIPDDLSGNPAILLIGYEQKAQFDIDRWLLGILDSSISATVIELPTIKGMIPGALSELIDNGMRSGIPKEDWYSVATVYDDAETIINAVGNERPRSAHVILLNKEGEILWNYYDGYSARVMLELKEKVKNLS
jgi:hypothetical protein